MSDLSERIARRRAARGATVEEQPEPGGGGQSALARRLRSRRQAAEQAPSGGVLSKKLEAARRRDRNPDKLDMRRIVDLPVDPFEWDEERVEQFSRDNVLAHAFHATGPFQGAKPFRFKPSQAQALDDYDRVGGGVLPIRVGGGKTGILIGIAERAWRKGRRRILALVPASVYPQLVKIDIAYWRKRVPLTVPFHRLGGQTPAKRRQIAGSGRDGCYIMPYSVLSSRRTKDDRGVSGSELLAMIAPDCIIGDEVHKVRNFSAARTRRLFSYIREEQPECVWMSGTITNRGVTDYHHLADSALRDGSPLPRDSRLAGAWGLVLDARKKPATRSQAGALLDLVRWARDTYPGEEFEPTRAGFRKAFQFRLRSAPGVVASGANTLGTSLYVHDLHLGGELPNPEERPGFKELVGHLQQMDDELVTPDGEELAHEMMAHRWLTELACGFYNRRYWPQPAALAKRRGITEDDALELLERSQAYLSAWQVYQSELRRYLHGDSIVEEVDTPDAVGRAIKNGRTGGLPGKMVALWHEAKERDFEGRIERDREAVRVCDFKVKWAMDWAEKKLRGNERAGSILWYYNIEVGQWLRELALERDLPLVYCPAGAHEELLEDKAERNRKSVIVASIGANHEGKNLQYMQEQFVLQWPRSAKVAEQMLGRCHREGQEADELIVNKAEPFDCDAVNLGACLNDAVYRQQTTGNEEKVVYCGWDPLPRVFSPEFLKEKGLRPKDLTAEQRAMMEERFGSWSDTLV